MQERIKKAAAILQAVALGQEPAQKALGYLSGLIKAETATFVNSNGLPDGSLPFEIFNAPPEAMTEYINSFATRDVQQQAMHQKWGVSLPPVLTDEDVLPRKDYVRSALFNDFYKRIGIHHIIALYSPEISQHGVSSMRIVFGAGTARGAFSDDDKAVLTAVSTHFNASAHLFAERRLLAHASLAAAFEHAADAVAILDCRGALRYSNQAFESFRTTSDPHSERHWGTPLDSPTFHALKAEFRAALIETGSSGLSARRCEFAIAGKSPRSSLRRFIGLVSTSLITAGVKTYNREPLFMLVIRESSAVHSEQILALRRRYKLTPMETQILRRFSDGQDLRTMAAELKVTTHTTRAHMKSLLSKTGCRKQTELLRLLENTPTGKIRLLI